MFSNIGGLISGTIPLQGILKQTAVPHIFPWNKPLSRAASTRIERANSRTKRRLAEEYEDMVMAETACLNVAAEETVAVGGFTIKSYVL